MAGKYFFCEFKKRNPGVVLRTPEATSLMRSTGFNKPQVDRFYDLLFVLYYNCDVCVAKKRFGH